MAVNGPLIFMAVKMQSSLDLFNNFIDKCSNKLAMKNEDWIFNELRIILFFSKFFLFYLFIYLFLWALRVI